MYIDLRQSWQKALDAIGAPESVRHVLTSSIAALAVHHAPTADHCMRVGIMASQIGEQISLPRKPLFYAGTLHDLGKLEVDAARLSKTAEWTPADREALANHPIDGYEKLIDERMIVTAGLVIRHHTFQPHPYPKTTPKQPPYMVETFAQCARVVSLADYYDAAHRPNSQGLTSGTDIRNKINEHNPDQHQLIGELYESGVFSVDERPF